jgi:hypothetical protein
VLAVFRDNRHDGKDPREPWFVKTHLCIPAKEKADALSGAQPAKNAAVTKESALPALNMRTMADQEF